MRRLGKELLFLSKFDKKDFEEKVKTTPIAIGKVVRLF